MFGGMFGGGGGRRNGPMKGRDIQKAVSITFEEAYKGTKREISFEKYATCTTCHGEGNEPGTEKKTCPHCNGTGQVHTVQNTPFGRFQSSGPCQSCGGRGKIIEKPCHTCGGSGKVRKTVRINVDIPAGVDNDSVIPIRGQGEPGVNGGPAGDLYVVISVKSHKIFHRHGDDLYIEIPITFDQAALGDDLTVPSMDGKISYKIPAGTQPDTTFRLRDKGMPNVRNGRHGDLYVKVKLEVPRTLNDEQRKAIKDMSKTLDADCYKAKKSFGEKLKDLFK